MKTVKLSIQRFNPEKDDEPHWQSYVIDADLEQSWLSVLHAVKAEQDSSLTYRWSCQMAICGSCGAMVNGVPKLLCQTFVNSYSGQSVRIAPLRYFPIIKDLVIDASEFLQKLQQVKPYIIHKTKQDLAKGETLQTPFLLRRYHQYSQCINCLLCYSACPQYGRHSAFVGPAALNLAHRYHLDPRDEGTDERRAVTGSAEGIWECTFAGLCSKVCPKHVDPGAAIQQMKLEHTLDQVLPFPRVRHDKKQ